MKYTYNFQLQSLITTSLEVTAKIKNLVSIVSKLQKFYKTDSFKSRDTYPFYPCTKFYRRVVKSMRLHFK